MNDKLSQTMDMADDKVIVIDDAKLAGVTLAPDETLELKAGEEVIGYVQDTVFEAEGQ